jgi:hypothetical protein
VNDQIQLGLAFEESVRLYPRMVWQPGQTEIDGVTENPDVLVNHPYYDNPHYVLVKGEDLGRVVAEAFARTNGLMK